MAAPLAFVYDRNVTKTPGVLDQRVAECCAYAHRRGWQVAGVWIDHGDDALTTERPEFTALVTKLRALAPCGPVICLVHTWQRLAYDGHRRLALQQRIAQAGGHCATAFGENDARPEAVPAERAST